MAYSVVEPWGEPMESWRAGMLAAVVSNSQKVRGQRPAKPTDFLRQLPPSRRLRETTIHSPADIERVLARVAPIVGDRKDDGADDRRD